MTHKVCACMCTNTIIDWLAPIELYLYVREVNVVMFSQCRIIFLRSNLRETKIERDSPTTIVCVILLTDSIVTMWLHH